MTVTTRLEQAPAAPEDAPLFETIGRLGGQTVAYSLASAIPAAVAFVLAPVYTHLLTPAEYGYWALAQTLTSLAFVLFHLGLFSGATRYFYSATTEAGRRRLLGTTWYGVLAWSSALTALSLAGFILLRAHMGMWSLYAGLALVNAFFLLGPQLAMSILTIEGKAKTYMALAASQAVLGALVSFTVVWQGYGVAGAIGGATATNGAFFLGYLAYNARRTDVVIETETLRKLASYGIPMQGIVLAWWAMSSTDRLLLEWWAGEAAVGLYAIAATFALALNYVSLAFNQGWTVLFFSVASRSEEAVKSLAASVGTYYTATLAFGALAIALLCGPFMESVFDADFHDARRLVPLLALGGLSYGLYFLPSRSIFHRTRNMVLLLLMLAGIVANLGVGLLLVPRFAGVGVALAFVLANLLILVLTFVASQRILPIRYEWGRLARVATAFVGPMAVALYAETWGEGLMWTPAILLLAAYPILLAALGFLRADERRALRRLMRWKERGAS